jgi:penicillin-binding protein 2
MRRKESQQRPVFTRRALLLGGVQIAIFAALTARLYRMQVLEHGKYARLARRNSVNERLLAAERGLILDRYGAPLAANARHWRALFMAVQAPDPQAVLTRIQTLIALTPQEQARITHDLGDRPRYVPVLLKDYLDWRQMARLEVHATELPGVIIDAGESRVYPLGAAAAHVIGYVAKPTPAQAADDPVLALPGARVGRAGVEAARETALRGSPGFVRTEVNMRGEVVRELDRDNGRQGDAVRLSLDAGLQALAASMLAGQAGAAVVLDARNGEVLAMTSQPGFDPALFDTGVPNAVWRQWVDDPMRPLADRATAGLYAPGSTFKPNVALAALEAGAITVETRFFCPGYLKLGNHTFYCWRHRGHGAISLVNAIQQSCDVFFYHTALATGIDAIAAMGRRLGLIGKPALGLPGVDHGFLPTHEWARERRLAWTQGNTVIQGIGQGYTQVTPFGLATMVARIASGQALGPHITRSIDGVAQPGSKAADWTSLGLDQRHLAAVRQGMFEAVNTPSGTAYASRLTVPGVYMAGKTGTAQVHAQTAAQEKANFNDALLPWKFRPNAFFIGFAPAEAPRYAAAVVVEHGNEGADVAAPIVKALMTKALSREAGPPLQVSRAGP